MQGFIHGSGGLPLNFKVVGGTTEPANPKENTLWANTDQKITSWHFANNEPTESIKGMLWIQTGATNVINFNVLKKNAIHVYPVAGKQYIDDAWVYVDLRIYKDGKWNAFWDGTLYKAGNQYEEVTGGWVDRRQDGYWGNKNNKIEFREDRIYLFTDSRSICAVSPANKTDLTGINTIEVTYLSGTIVSGSKLFVSEGNVNEESTMAAFVGMTSGSKTAQLDVSHLTGEYYVGVCTGQLDSNSSSFHVSEVRVLG